MQEERRTPGTCARGSKAARCCSCHLCEALWSMSPHRPALQSVGMVAAQQIQPTAASITCAWPYRAPGAAAPAPAAAGCRLPGHKKTCRATLCPAVPCRAQVIRLLLDAGCPPAPPLPASLRGIAQLYYEDGLMHACYVGAGAQTVSLLVRAGGDPLAPAPGMPLGPLLMAAHMGNWREVQTVFDVRPDLRESDDGPGW